MSSKRFATSIAGGAAATAAIAALTAAPVNAAEIWIALAYSPRQASTTAAWGTGADAQEATNVAKQRCLDQGGTDCQQLSAGTKLCLAAVFSPENGRAVAAGGDSLIEAEDAAHTYAKQMGLGPTRATLIMHCRGGGTGGEPPAAAPTTTTVESATDVWTKPSHEGGEKVIVDGEPLVLEPEDVVSLAAPCTQKTWCTVSNPKIPGGTGAVWGGQLKVPKE